MRTTERVTITVPKDLLAKAKADVELGIAPSVSAWIADAMDHKGGGEKLLDVLDDLDDAFGGAREDDEEVGEWARKMLSRSYWTQERSSHSSEEHMRFAGSSEKLATPKSP